MQRKKMIILIIGLFVLLISIIGISYAIWQITNIQNDFNTLGSKCFEVTLTEESDAITIDKAYPIPDEEGLQESGYTFTIKNTCNTNALYEVKLEDIIPEEKRLSGEYIKVSLNDGTPEILTNKEEASPTIELADKAYLLTSGSLTPEEEVTYTLKLWMDENTPVMEETTNSTFISKISVEAGYIEESGLENEITIEAISETESINKESETFKISGTSVKYNIVEYSEDNSHWTRINNPSKTFEITKTYNQEGTYKFYIKDEVGNIKETIMTTTKIDQTSPIIEMGVIDNQEKINLNLTLKDEKSGLAGYQITTSEEEPSEWISISGSETTIDYEIITNNAYYIWVKDVIGNISYKTYTATTIDNQAPELEVTNELSEWGLKDKIIINGIDDVTGISGYSVSKEESIYEWQEVPERPLTYQKEIEITENGTYYVSIKDEYEHITTKSIIIDKIDNVLPTIVNSLGTNTVGDNGWYQALNINVVLNDNESGISSAKYCVTTESSCTPNINATINENSFNVTFESNASAQKICTITTDNVGNESEVTCSDQYKVDTTNPVAKISATVNENNITISANGSSDIHSGIANYQYSKDNQNWYTSASNSYTFTSLAPATYTLYVKVVDKAGRVSSVVSTKATVQNLKATDKILSLANNGQLLYDGTSDNNLRYIGADPNNYVSFNNELWRIIGVFKNIENGSGAKETRLKITRSTTLGNKKWDNKGAYGKNDWTTSALQIELNETYFNSISDNYRQMIGNAKYNLGGPASHSGLTVYNWYTYERGAEVYYNNPTHWIGKIGLIYPSDYGFSVSGDTTISRQSCITGDFAAWGYYENPLEACNNSTWLKFYNSFGTWTITPASSHSYTVVSISDGVYWGKANLTKDTIIALYLTSSVKITGGSGTSSNPYILSL